MQNSMFKLVQNKKNSILKNSTTQIVTKLQNSNCDKTQIPKNSKTKIAINLIMVICLIDSKTEIVTGCYL